MTIVKDFGDWHIEVHDIDIDINDGAGVYTSADANLDKPGKFLFANMYGRWNANDDNIQAIGFTALMDQSSSTIALFEEITAIKLRAFKQAGTAGLKTIKYQVAVALAN